MTRRMSCSMTVPQVEAREKTETRRHVDTWKDLKPGDRLTLIEKGMGLAKGEKQRVLAEVIVTAVDVEPLHWIDEDGCTAEGFPDMDPWEFVRFWLDGHGYRRLTAQSDVMGVNCRLIKWKYLPASWWCEKGTQYLIVDAVSPGAAKRAAQARLDGFGARDVERIASGAWGPRLRRLEGLPDTEFTARLATADDLTAWAEIQQAIAVGVSPVELSPEQVMRASGADGLFG